MRIAPILLPMALSIAVLSACQSGKPEVEVSVPQQETAQQNDSEPKSIPGRVLWNGHTIDANKIVAGSESILTVMDRSGSEMRRGQTSIATTMDIKQVAALNGAQENAALIYVLMSQKDGEDVLYAFTNGDQGKLETIEIPELPENLAASHMGGDSLYVAENTLYRKMQIQRKDAPAFDATVLYFVDAESGEIRVTEQR